MGGSAPVVVHMAIQTQGCTRVVHHQKISKLVVMWIVARGALDLVVLVQLHLAGERCRWIKGGIGSGQLVHQRLAINE